MSPDYQRWLIAENYDHGTISTQLSRAARIEEYYGDLDKHYDFDELQSVYECLRYSSQDTRRDRPNPSRLPINGDLYNNLASYKSAVQLYRRFREGSPRHLHRSSPRSSDNADAIREVGSTYWTHMGDHLNGVLRRSIGELEEGLEIVDGGGRLEVDSGSIDITATDGSRAIVVIELNAEEAGQRAVAQILSHMGDVARKYSRPVRGILVASGFN